MGSFMRKGLKFTSMFDDDAEFYRHCRGQGVMYNGKAPLSVYDDNGSHFNFAGRLSGLCCFCALKSGLSWFESDGYAPLGSGFGSKLFSQLGCINCRHKEWLRSVVARIFRSGAGGRKAAGRSGHDGAISTWASDGWLALPSAMLDNIIVFVIGLDGCMLNQLPVLDCDVVAWS